MAHFSCPQCRFTVAEPICPSCNRFLTDDVALAESCMKAPRWDLPDKIEWCTAFGHWGDVFCCIGVIKSLLARTGQTTVNVLYVGPDLDIVDWLKEQDCVGEVIGIRSSDVEFYKQFWGATSKPGSAPEVWLGMLHEQMRGLPTADKFVQTHINAAWFETKFGLPAQLWQGGTIPEISNVRAGMLLEKTVPSNPGGQLYHLHPVSTMSESAHNHWPHWLAAIEWLLEKTPHTYVLTGLNEIRFLPKSQRLVNLIGETKSNLEVLAISGMCDGVISTPNSVAIWSVVQGQRCLSVGNLVMEFLSNYYRRFLQRGERLTYLNVDTPFSVFQHTVCEWLEGGEA